MATDRKTIVLDVDDAGLYRIDSGLHDAIKERICRHANADPFLRENAAWLGGADRIFARRTLAVVFPLIVMAYKKQGKSDLEVTSMPSTGMTTTS